VVGACAKALAFLSREEDAEVTAAFAYMVDGRLNSRQESARNIGRCARGNVVAIAALRRMLRDQDALVRAEAALALQKVSAQGDAATLHQIAALFADAESAPRIAALECLAKLVAMAADDAEAVAAAVRGAVALLEDEHSAVRVHVSQAMAAVVAGGSADATKALVREACFAMCSSKLPRCRPAPPAPLCPCARRRAVTCGARGRARKEAMHALTMVLDEGNTLIIQGVASCFLDHHIEVPAPRPRPTHPRHA
jgi:hypothetical protein